MIYKNFQIFVFIFFKRCQKILYLIFRNRLTRRLTMVNLTILHSIHVSASLSGTHFGAISRFFI